MRKILSVLLATALLLTGCGSSYCDHILMDPNYSHTLITKVDATCTSDGYSLYECSCGKLHKTSVFATGHMWEDITDGKLQMCTTCGVTRMK